MPNCLRPMTDANNNLPAEHPEEIPPEFQRLFEIIADLPEEKRKEILGVFSMSMSVETERMHRGPLPDPETLKSYDEIVEGGAERIFKMAENQSSHRMAIENKAITSQLQQGVTGQWMGFVLGFLGLAVAFGLAFLGHDTVAGIIGSTTIVGLASVFVIGKKLQSKD